MQELSEINGTVAAVIFRNDENGYGVVKLELDNGGPDNGGTKLWWDKKN